MGLTVYGGGGKPEEEKTVTAGTSVIEVNPSSGKAMKKVTVNPTPTESKEVTAGTSDITLSPTDGKHFSGVTVHPTPSQEKTVIPTAGGFKVSPDTGKLLSAVFVDGDSDLVGENIKQGVNIFGVDGSFDNSHGEYAWGKYLSGTITVTQANQNENPTILQLASNDIDLGLLTKKDFYGYSGTMSGASSLEFFFSENGFGYGGVITSQYTYDSVNHQLKLGESFSGLYTFPNYEAKIIQGYVVSDKSDAYPDGGIQDGYWYEKVAKEKEKEVIVKSGEYTFSGVKNKITIPHGIGKKPNYFGITNASLYTNYNSASVSVNADATNLEVTGYFYLGDYDHNTTINWNAVYIGG